MWACCTQRCRKHSDAGRDWGQEEKGKTEDEMAGWHHRLNGRESEWPLGDGDGQGGLACCNSWGHKESDTTERLNWTELNKPIGGEGEYDGAVCLMRTGTGKKWQGRKFPHSVCIEGLLSLSIGLTCITSNESWWGLWGVGKSTALNVSFFFSRKSQRLCHRKSKGSPNWMKTSSKTELHF